VVYLRGLNCLIYSLIYRSNTIREKVFLCTLRVEANLSEPQLASDINPLTSDLRDGFEIDIVSAWRTKFPRQFHLFTWEFCNILCYFEKEFVLNV
jgi:hypothetical protein